MGNGTAIGRVRGLGSAHHGTGHWLLQRFTAAGNLVLVVFFAISLLMLPDLSYATVSQWLGQAVPAVAMALLVISVFWHARLGLQVLVEDYLDGAARFAAILLLNLAAFAGIAAGLFFIARIAMAAMGQDMAEDMMRGVMAGAGQ